MIVRDLVERDSQTIAGSLPSRHEREVEWAGIRGGRPLVGGDVSPLVKLCELREPRRVSWIGSRQVEAEAEALEVGFQVVEVWVAVIELAMGGELSLEEDSEGRPPHLRYEDLAGLRVEVAAEPLKVGTQRHHISPQVLIGQVGIWCSHGRSHRALRINLGQARHPVVLPTD